jgi:predicted nucleic acid-binding Zn ribbon protein
MNELELIESVGRKPGHFGDIIIFWEVPDCWTILTRDKTFTLLQTKTKRAVRIYYVRMPRIVCSDQCDVIVSLNEQRYSAIMIDFSATGLCLKCDAPLGSINSVVGVAGPRLNGFREGRIVRAQQTPEGMFYGIKFIRRKDANR